MTRKRKRSTSNEVELRQEGQEKAPRQIPDVLSPPRHHVEVDNHNAMHSPLLRLPAELRNRIYHYALGGLWIKLQLRHDLGKNEYVGQSVQYKAQPRPEPLSLPSWDTPHRQRQLFALPLTCRQVYSETHLLPYTLNFFHIEVDRISLNNFVKGFHESHISIAAASAKLASIYEVLVPLNYAHGIVDGRSMHDYFAPPARFFDSPLTRFFDSPLTEFFPKLKCIYLNKCMVRQSETDLKRYVHGLKELEGCDVIVLRSPLELQEIAAGIDYDERGYPKRTHEESERVHSEARVWNRRT